MKGQKTAQNLSKLEKEDKTRLKLYTVHTK